MECDAPGSSAAGFLDGFGFYAFLGDTCWCLQLDAYQPYTLLGLSQGESISVARRLPNRHHTRPGISRSVSAWKPYPPTLFVC